MAVTKTPITLPVKKVPKYQEPTAGNMITLGLLLTGLIAFVFLRMPDIIAALVPFPMTGLSVFILLLTIATTIVKPPTEMSKLVKRFGILIVVIFQLKSDLDTKLVQKYHFENMSGDIAVISDATGSLGFDLARQLYIKGNATVVMGCNDMSLCNEKIQLWMNEKLNLHLPSPESEQFLDSEVEEEGKEDRKICKAEEESTNGPQCVSPSMIPGSVVAYPLELSDFDSIRLFSEWIHTTFDHVDYLINNGGRGHFYSDKPENNETHTAQGYEMSMGVMHFGQYYLTKCLYDMLLAPLPLSSMSDDQEAHGTVQSYAKSPDVFASRVIYVGSFAYFQGNFGESFINADLQVEAGADESGVLSVEDMNLDLKGEVTNNCGKMFHNLIPCCPLFSCPVTNGYARAALAQILNVHELQSRVDRKAFEKHGNYRRLVTAVVNPGFLAPPKTKSSLIKQAFGLMTRSAEDSVHVIVYAMLSHNFIPGSYIDSMLISHDLMKYKPTLEQTHAVVYPSTRSLGFLLDDGRSVSLKAKENNYDETYHAYRSKSIPFKTISTKLWEVSDAIVKAYEKKNV